MSKNPSLRNKFPIYKKNPDLVYFDSSASSLVPSSVIKSQNEYYSNNGTNVHRGTYKLSYEATLEFDEARKKVASFINAKEEEIIFTKGTTDSFNLLSNRLIPKLLDGDLILTSQLEHHSAILPYYKKNVIFTPLTNNRITLEGIQKAMNERVRIVILTHGANTFGFITPIEEIVKYLRKFNCIIILDCAQTIMHKKIDVKDLDVDFLAFSGHKIFGPNGIGVLYGKKQLLEELEPLQYGGEMVEKVFKDHAIYKDLPFKHEAGTPNISGAIGLGYAIDFIRKNITKKTISYLDDLKQYLLSKMTLLSDIEIYSLGNELPIILFNVRGVHPHDIASYLDSYNICLRAGFHCAQLVSDLLDEAWTLRISIGVYNNYEDCEKLITRLNEAISYFKGK